MISGSIRYPNIASAVLLVALFGSGPVPADNTQPVGIASVINPSYSTAEPASQPSLLRWDFSRGKRYLYDVTLDTHEVEKTRTASVNNLSLRSEKTAIQGTLSVASTFDKHARLVLVRQTSGQKLHSNGEIERIDDARSTHVVERMSAAGAFYPRSPLDHLLALVMALPDRPLTTGDSVLLTHKVPTGSHFNGSPGILKSDMVLTLTRFVHCHDHLCAELSGTIDIHQRDPGNPLDGTHTVNITLAGTHIFDTGSGRLVEYSGTLRSHMDSDIPMASPGENVSGTMPYSHRVLTRETRIAVRYRDENRSRGQKLTVRKYQRPVAE